MKLQGKEIVELEVGVDDELDASLLHELLPVPVPHIRRAEVRDKRNANEEVLGAAFDARVHVVPLCPLGQGLDLLNEALGAHLHDICLDLGPAGCSPLRELSLALLGGLPDRPENAKVGLAVVDGLGDGSDHLRELKDVGEPLELVQLLVEAFDLRDGAIELKVGRVPPVRKLEELSVDESLSEIPDLDCKIVNVLLDPLSLHVLNGLHAGLDHRSGVQHSLPELLNLRQLGLLLGRPHGGWPEDGEGLLDLIQEQLLGVLDALDLKEGAHDLQELAEVLGNTLEVVRKLQTSVHLGHPRLELVQVGGGELLHDGSEAVLVPDIFGIEGAQGVVLSFLSAGQGQDLASVDGEDGAILWEEARVGTEDAREGGGLDLVDVGIVENLSILGGSPKEDQLAQAKGREESAHPGGWDVSLDINGRGGPSVLGLDGNLKDVIVVGLLILFVGGYATKDVNLSSRARGQVAVPLLPRGISHLGIAPLEVSLVKSLKEAVV